MPVFVLQDFVLLAEVSSASSSLGLFFVEQDLISSSLVSIWTALEWKAISDLVLTLRVWEWCVSASLTAAAMLSREVSIPASTSMV